MGLSVSDAKSLISLLKSLQSAYDALGKSRRDLRFELKQRGDLDATVYQAFMSIDTLFNSVLTQGDDLETRVLVAIAEAVESGA
jgi:hypothetical protein